MTEVRIKLILLGIIRDSDSPGTPAGNTDNIEVAIYFLPVADLRPFLSRVSKLSRLFVLAHLFEKGKNLFRSQQQHLQQIINIQLVYARFNISSRLV